jgi:hypothetical protein
VTLAILLLAVFLTLVSLGWIPSFGRLPDKEHSPAGEAVGVVNTGFTPMPGYSARERLDAIVANRSRRWGLQANRRVARASGARERFARDVVPLEVEGE